jgi:septal ring factor EnvC (AmiA/AmiB activator)
VRAGALPEDAKDQWLSLAQQRTDLESACARTSWDLEQASTALATARAQQKELEGQIRQRRRLLEAIKDLSSAHEEVIERRTKRGQRLSDWLEDLNCSIGAERDCLAKLDEAVREAKDQKTKLAAEAREITASVSQLKEELAAVATAKEKLGLLGPVAEVLLRTLGAPPEKEGQVRPVLAELGKLLEIRARASVQPDSESLREQLHQVLASARGAGILPPKEGPEPGVAKEAPRNDDPATPQELALPSDPGNRA